MTPTATQVVDVTISPVPGAQQYNIYMGATTTIYLMVGTSVQSGVTYTGSQTANSVGGLRFTLQGATPAAERDSAVGGHRDWRDEPDGGAHPRPVRPVLEPARPVLQRRVRVVQRVAGRLHRPVRRHPPSTNAVFTALDGLWENNGMNNVTPGVYRADPSEIVADGGDLMRLANDILNQGSGLNYLLNISQDQISGVRAGAAVAEFVNPITRSTLKLTVHPWMSQGTALLMSYQLPQTWSHVDNAWEMACVQDYVSVNATFSLN